MGWCSPNRKKLGYKLHFFVDRNFFPVYKIAVGGGAAV